MSGLTVKLIQMVVVALMGLCAAQAFTDSGIGAFLLDWVKLRSAPLGESLPAMVWGLLFGFGVLFVVVRGRSTGAFALLAAIFSLPAILAYNLVNPLIVLGVHFSLDTATTFNEALGIGLFIMLGYLVLDSTEILWQSQLDLKRRRANQRDVEQVSMRNQLYLMLFAVCTVLIVTVLLVLSNTGSTLIFHYLNAWGIAAVSLGAALALTLYLFWVGSGHGPEKTK